LLGDDALIVETCSSVSHRNLIICCADEKVILCKTSPQLR